MQDRDGVVVEATVTLGDAQAAQIVSELVRERASSRFLLDPKDFGNYEVSDITVIGGADAEPREVDSEPEYDAREQAAAAAAARAAAASCLVSRGVDLGSRGGTCWAW